MKKKTVFLITLLCGIFLASEPGNINAESYKIQTDGSSSYNYADELFNWSEPVKSYIMQNKDGSFTRVENIPYYYANTDADDYDDKIVVETYSNSGQILSTASIKSELTLWGGFFSGSSYNYFVFGDINPDESNSTEVIRVVKYSKDWKRISSCSIKGANTVQPFDFGSMRMTESGGKLYLHTCHVMYFYDGANHQANMSFVIDENTMKVTQSFYGINTLAKGYVSHSFNQFVKVDGNYIYRVDHGDANPRSVTITKANINSISACTYATAMKIGGTYANDSNYTGVSLGGFELSSDNCIIAGKSIPVTGNWKNDSTGNQNIFLSIVNKSTLKSNIVWLTSGTDILANPKLVKINNNKFVVMWENTSKGKTEMIAVDGSGKALTKTVSADAVLSDCQPIAGSDGNIIWYAPYNERPLIYSVDINDVSFNDHTVTEPVVTTTYITTAETRPVTEITTTETSPVTEITSTQTRPVTGITASVTEPVTEIITTVPEEINPDRQGTCGSDMIWKFYSKTGTLEISGTGYMDNYYNENYSPWHDISDDIKEIQINGEIRSLGVNCFLDCKNLKKIQLPETLLTINSGAFMYCSSLSSVHIPETVTYIDAYAFAYCSSLSEIIIPENVYKIGFSAFKFCSSLKYAVIENPECYISDEDTFSTSYSNGSFKYNGKIYGYSGSSAQLYCKTTQKTFEDLRSVKKGDVDFSGDITVSDLLLLQKHIIIDPEFTRSQTETADINNDGNTDIFDLILLKRMLLYSI